MPRTPRNRPPEGSRRGLPTREELREWIEASPERVGKRDIARAFGIGPADKPALRELLRSLETEGTLERGPQRRFAPSGRLPETAVVEVYGTDLDGDPLARPVGWQGPNPPTVLMAPERRGMPALGPGDRVLARLRPIGANKYEGRTIRRISEAPAQVLGVFEGGASSGGRIVPTNRRLKQEFRVPAGETGGAEPGELVLAELLPAHGFGLKPARIVKRVGRFSDPRAASLIAIHTHDIPVEFPAEAVAEAERAGAVPLGDRTDLRAVPLVTIDGADARDFDDAVFAEPLAGADGGGWRVVVAIADVAWYVPPGSALDRAARQRGNSVYFPDRVVPMLPEALSNGWCSLRPNEDRGCLACEILIDAEGEIRRHRFMRGLMRSAARLTYEQVQAAREGRPEKDTPPLPESLLAHLYGAFQALLAARIRRGAIDLDLPERRVTISPEGQVTGIAPRQRLDSHRLIEEFMIAANVAAAETLERAAQPCMYRVHDRPSDEKLDALREFLGGLGIGLARGRDITPKHFAQVLIKVEEHTEKQIIHEVILRSQAQAAYSPDNLGHFGLGLARYAHFTSPIRRYADLLVHRALIRGRRLGPGGLPDTDPTSFADAAEHITRTERRATEAERDAADRYVAAFLSDRVGARFGSRISGVTRFGLFVTLDETGASGFVPMASLPNDRYMLDPSRHTLTGRHSRLSFRLGQRLDVVLREASPVTGGLLFRPAEDAGNATERMARRRRR
ncbi:MAG: ribonuclease R [Alphaproteobacteria bacterium]|nr:ribonuclease R [Alphaproteobacteria bacterium]